MSGKAFISVSGIDKTKADTLLSMASQFLYDIYYEKFIDGETLLRQMKDKVSECSVFIFFASRDSLDSVWCNFELDLAELEVIKRGIKVYVFPIEKDIPFSSIPAWMRAYWIDMEPRNARVGARRLSKIFRKELIPPILQGAVERIEDVNRARISHMKQYQCAPNVFFFSGPPLIGRRTTFFGKELWSRPF